MGSGAPAPYVGEPRVDRRDSRCFRHPCRTHFPFSAAEGGPSGAAAMAPKSSCAIGNYPPLMDRAKEDQAWSSSPSPLVYSVDRLRVFLKPPSSATAAKHDHAKMAIALSERESVHSDRTARRSTSRSNIRSGNITGLSPPSLLRTPARKRHLAAVGATRLPRSIRSELQRESDRRNPILFSG